MTSSVDPSQEIEDYSDTEEDIFLPDLSEEQRVCYFVLLAVLSNIPYRRNSKVH